MAAARKSKSSARSSSRGKPRSTRSSSRGGAASATTNHEKIRQWVEERGGRPACVKGTERGESCLLRIDFPGYSGEESLKRIGWDDFFDTFDQQKLKFLFQEQKKRGEPSYFSKLISRGQGKRGGAKRSTGRASSSSARRGSDAGRGQRKSAGRHGRGS